MLRSNLSSQIAERLRNDIVHGRIPAGTRLVQDELCERFGTSRMPVRDAMQRLTHEGLLEQQGQQRLVVTLGTEELAEAYEIMAVLHGWAARKAAMLATEAELQEFAQVCNAAVAADETYEFGTCAMAFHKKINMMAHSMRLVRSLKQFQQTVPRAFPFNIPEEMAWSKKCFESIENAIRDRDPEAAERLTRQMSMRGVELLRQSIEAARKGAEGGKI